MKSRINVYVPKLEEKDLKFPIWARNKDGAIVLFSSIADGTVIKQGINTNFPKQGTRYKYAQCNDVDVREILPRGTKITITLCKEEGDHYND